MDLKFKTLYYRILTEKFLKIFKQKWETWKIHFRNFCINQLIMQRVETFPVSTFSPFLLPSQSSKPSTAPQLLLLVSQTEDSAIEIIKDKTEFIKNLRCKNGIDW